MYDGKPIEKAGNVMTSRELADAINDLIVGRITSHALALNGYRGSKEIDEYCEVLLRQIADGLKRLDHNAGVAVEDVQRVLPNLSKVKFNPK